MVRHMAASLPPWSELDTDERDRAILRQLGAGRSLADLADERDTSVHELGEHCGTPRFEAVAEAALERQRGLARLSARFLAVSSVTSAHVGKNGMATAADLEEIRKLAEATYANASETATDKDLQAAVRLIENQQWKLTHQKR